jgi:hypothetical protein
VPRTGDLQGEFGRDPNFPSRVGRGIDSGTEYVHGVWVNVSTAQQSPSASELCHKIMFL